MFLENLVITGINTISPEKIAIKELINPIATIKCEIKNINTPTITERP